MSFYKATFAISGKDHDGYCSGEDADNYETIDDPIRITLFVKTFDPVGCASDLNHDHIGCTSEMGSGYCEGFEQHYECIEFTQVAYYPNKFDLEYDYGGMSFFKESYCRCPYYPIHPRKCGKCVGALVEPMVRLPECLTHIVMQYAGNLTEPVVHHQPAPRQPTQTKSVPHQPAQTRWTKILNVLKYGIETLTS
jgi:hypothetical protein